MNKSTARRRWSVVVLGAVTIWSIAKPRTVDDRERGTATIAFYVDEAYPRWRAATGGTCPRDLQSLAQGRPTRDPWGNDLVMACTTLIASGAPTLLIRSAGPDRRIGTADDLDSHMTTTYQREAALVSNAHR